MFVLVSVGSLSTRIYSHICSLICSGSLSYWCISGALWLRCLGFQAYWFPKPMIYLRYGCGFCSYIKFLDIYRIVSERNVILEEVRLFIEPSSIYCFRQWNQWNLPDFFYKFIDFIYPFDAIFSVSLSLLSCHVLWSDDLQCQICEL